MRLGDAKMVPVSCSVALRTDGFRASPARAKPRASALSRIVAVACWAQALAGCAAGLAAPSAQPIAMPVPARALLAAPPKPDCTFHETGLGDTVSDAAQAARQKLEYERECYRRAEMQMRARVRRLQALIAAGMKPAASARCGGAFLRLW